MKIKEIFYNIMKPHKAQKHIAQHDMETDLETALELAGAGTYQIFHCSLMVATLGSSILEMIGSSFILPSAACDLELEDRMRGIIASIPNLGIILTAPFWGPVADAVGRKPVLLFTTLLSGIIGLTAAFMPNLLSFALCKFASSLFLSCPSSLGFAYAGELMPKKRRDLALLVCNASLMLIASLCPILAWGVFSMEDFIQSFSKYLRPWRVLTMVYSLPLILSALWLTQCKESPKFLMMKEKTDEALNVLKHIYAFNSGQHSEHYKVTSLVQSQQSSANMSNGQKCDIADDTRKISALSLLRPPHLKWLALTGFLMFGLFSLLNGLFLFVPNTINQMMVSNRNETASVCSVLHQANSARSAVACVDSISFSTFQVTVGSAIVYGAIVMLASLSPLSKKTLLISMFTFVGVSCIVAVTVQNKIVTGVFMSALEMTALGIGPLNAFAVQMFPTSLRATAVGAVMMFGRVGSVMGANISGVFLANGCIYTFCAFAALLFICAGLSFLLPNDQPKTDSKR